MSSSSSPSKPWALIVGAGPSGLLLGLMLARRGIPVQLIDMSTKLDEQPRATHYGPPAVSELRRAGVADEIRAQGISPDGTCWRKLDGTLIAGLSAKAVVDHPDRIVCLPLGKVGKILYDHIQHYPCASVAWGQKVLRVGQDDDKAWVEVETAEGETKRLEAKYVIGCDGANSQVRRTLFGDKTFPGKTWDVQVVATNTYYDFSKFGWLDANFIIHPEHWYMAARIGKDGLWRVTYGEKPGLTREQLQDQLPQKFKAMLPGHPDPDDYRVVNFSPYKVHQRLAPSMRVGRILLAADAAHLCNPFGGMGLTGGIVDVGGLYDCLAGLHAGLADASILDKYSEIRRQKFLEIIDPVSSKNIVRLNGQDPDTALDNDAFLQMCRRADTDDEFSRSLQMGSMALKHDFTQYYHTRQSNGVQH